jgi:preprotein translocase subunit YajC
MLKTMFPTVSLILVQTTQAFAQAAPAAATVTPEAAPAWMQFVPIAVIMFVFYFFLIRPQAKKQKEQVNFLSTLKSGDQVITQSGILGKISSINDHIVNLEIANNVNIKILKSQVLALQNTAVAQK